MDKSKGILEEVKTKLNKIRSIIIGKYQVIAQYIIRKQKLIIVYTVIGVFIIGSLFGVYLVNTDKIYHVVVDGQEIGIVNDKSVVEEWEADQFNKLALEYTNTEIKLNNDIVLVSQRKYKADYNNTETLESLENLVKYDATGISILVDGISIGVVENQEIADNLMNMIKDEYMPNKDSFVSASSVEDDNIEESVFKDIEVLEEVAFQNIETTPEEIISEDDMLILLKKGTLEEKIYTVQKGDTISGIAYKFDLTQEQLRNMNPTLKEEFIQIGDELIVTALTPPVTIRTTEITKQIERISYSIEYKYDNSMFLNESEVLVQGVEGKKLVEYEIIKENGNIIEKIILSEEKQEDPTTKVILKGTKFIPTKGSGTLSWPTVGGFITSPYGPRWGSFHSGIDISGVSDRTIKAADTGTIVYTGYRGGYGNCVIIDHSNGIRTLYAHLNSISVTLGSSIAKGQKIGVMGTTGNSSGVHLHFEVIVNGENKNPINYVGN